MVCKLLAQAIRKLKGKKMQIGMEEVKVSLFADDMIVYISNHKSSTRALLQMIGYKIKITVVLLYTNTK